MGILGLILSTGCADTVFPLVSSADVKFKINLNKLHIEHNRYCRYDPEVFPGLTYRMKVPDVVLLIFHR